MSGDTIRAFMAIKISEEIRTALQRVQSRLRGSGARVSWVDPGNIHLTLVFLGDLPSERIAELQQDMDRVAGSVPPFLMEVEGVGHFGGPRSPRVIWAGVAERSGALSGLQQGLADAARASGVSLESRPFHPHLTLGRVRSRRGAGALTSALASDSVTVRGTVQVDHVHLFESRLHPEGARYTILHSSRLKGEP